MKKINFIILIVFAFISTNLLFANPISESDALKKAKQFYDQYQSVSSGKSSVRNIADLQLVYTCADSVSPKKVLTNKSNVTTSVQNTYFYIFNNTNQKGFIIVSADDATKEILGYSDEVNFSVEKIPMKQMNTNKDTIQGSLTELSNMMKEVYVYEFRSGGLFKVTDKAKKEIVLGDYTLTKDGELLTLINGGVDVEYKLIKTSEKHIKLISKKDASTMELSKN